MSQQVAYSLTAFERRAETTVRLINSLGKRMGLAFYSWTRSTSHGRSAGTPARSAERKPSKSGISSR